MTFYGLDKSGPTNDLDGDNELFYLTLHFSMNVFLIQFIMYQSFGNNIIRLARLG